MGGYMKDAIGRRLDSFLPSRDLPNVLLWLDASTLTGANGSDVRRWPDLASRGQDPSRFAGACPSLKTNGLDGKNTVVFNGSFFSNPTFGSNGLAQPGTGWAQPLMMAAVVKFGSAAATAQPVFGGSTSSPISLQASTSGTLQVTAGATGAVGGPVITDDQWHIVVGAFDPGGAFGMVDGYVVQSVGGGVGANLMTQLNVGSGGGAGNFLIGEIAEAVIMGDRVPFERVVALQEYFNEKWSLGKSIPRQDAVTYLDTVDGAGVNVRIWKPRVVHPSNTLVIWSHQSGGTETISTGYQGYPLVHALVNEGYTVIATRQHSENWGNANGVTDVTGAYNFALTTGAVDNVILLGASMGGLASSLSIPLGGIPSAKIKGVYGWDAVFDLRTLYSQATYTAGINTAHGITAGTLSGATSAGATSIPTTASFPTIGTQLMVGNGTANVEVVTTTGASNGTSVAVTALANTHASGDQVSDFPTKTAGRNPVQRSGSDWAGKRFRFTASTSDTAVPKAANADAMSALIAASATEYAVVSHPSGHLSGNGVNPADLIAFTRRCVGA
jgi:hypothetical protein